MSHLLDALEGRGCSDDDYSDDYDSYEDYNDDDAAPSKTMEEYESEQVWG